jgi:2-methylaconitate cis-trans-isomerase PrpF
MGSGDPYGRQLNGMGAGVSSLSKICLVEPHGQRVPTLEKSARFRAGFGGIDAARATAEATQAEDIAQMSGRGKHGERDIDYTFVGLGIEKDEVDVAGNCGNMSSAIGPYAYNAGLLPPRIYAKGDGKVTVTIRNTNTGKILNSTFGVAGGQAAIHGDYTIDGVTGKGSKIKLEFMSPWGSRTGAVLPTGQRFDFIHGYKVSCIDGATPAVFIRADDVGVEGTILPDDFAELPDKLALLERIRKGAAVAMGIAATEDAVPRTIPKIGLVSGSSSHPVLSGQTLKTSQMDLVVRFLSDTQPHRAIPLTAALTTAVAARVTGTVVEQMLAPEPVMEDSLTIGHASGRLQVDAVLEEGSSIIPKIATVYRTAKRLFEGNVFWTDNGEVDHEAGANYGRNGRHSLGQAFVLEHRGHSSSHLFEADPQQEAQDEEKRAKAQHEGDAFPEQPTVSYRPLGDRATTLDRPLQLSAHPETPLTSAIQRLHGHLTHVLSIPDLSTRPYPPDLVDTLTNSYTSITQFSPDDNQVTVVRKVVEDWVEMTYPKPKPADPKPKLFTREHLGLTKSGKPVWEQKQNHWTREAEDNGTTTQPVHQKTREERFREAAEKRHEERLHASLEKKKNKHLKSFLRRAALLNNSGEPAWDSERKAEAPGVEKKKTPEQDKQNRAERRKLTKEKKVKKLWGVER